MQWRLTRQIRVLSKRFRRMPRSRAPRYSMFAGSSQHLDAGSQVISLSHTQIIHSNLSITEIFGFIREKAYSTLDQPFSPQQLATYAATLSEIQSALSSESISKSDLLINTFG